MDPNKTILVAEDNQDDVLLIKLALKRAGITANILHVPNGEEAIKYFRGEGVYADRIAYPVVSLLLLDLKMPRLDGFDVLMWKREHPEWLGLPVVIITTSYYGPDIAKAYDLGANSFITKANDFNVFLDEMRQMANFWLGHVTLPEPGPLVPIPVTGATPLASLDGCHEHVRQTAVRGRTVKKSPSVSMANKKKKSKATVVSGLPSTCCSRYQPSRPWDFGI